MDRSHQRRDDIEAIIKAGIAAVEPATCVIRAVRLEGSRLAVAGREYDLSKIERILVLGAGKGSAAMAAGLESVLGGRIAGGRVTVKYGHSCPLTRVVIGEAGHPVPDEAGVKEAQEALKLAGDAGANDLVFCLISGGGSALWPAPVAPLTLPEKQAVTKLLLGCGASIDEINAVRKHLSRIKGGQLAAAVAPARLIGLMLSDVIGDRLDVIASGPTCPDAHRFADAWNVIGKYKLEERIPESAATYLRKGMAGQHPETPKPNSEIFARVQNEIVGSNTAALEAAAEIARVRGYTVNVITSSQSGDTVSLARDIAGRVDALRGQPGRQCLLWGGETTVVLCDEPGLGGRNQHLALSVAKSIQGAHDVTFASVGTDGTDGPTDAAGAIVDGETLSRGAKQGMDCKRHLNGHDSYPYLKACGDLVITGPTNTNVMDVQVLLVDGE